LFLVRCFESAARRSARFRRRGNLFVNDLKAMSVIPIAFVLIILLFGFDTIETVKTRRERNKLTNGGKTFAQEIRDFLKLRSLKA